MINQNWCHSQIDFALLYDLIEHWNCQIDIEHWCIDSNDKIFKMCTFGTCRARRAIAAFRFHWKWLFYCSDSKTQSHFVKWIRASRNVLEMLISNRMSLSKTYLSVSQNQFIAWCFFNLSCGNHTLNNGMHKFSSVLHILSLQILQTRIVTMTQADNEPTYVHRIW